MTAKRYLVCPHSEGEVAFATLSEALAFAEAAFERQVLTDVSPIGIFIDGEAVGQFGMEGWEVA